MTLPSRGINATPMTYDLTISDRVARTFWGKVDVGEPDECWPWLGKTFRGYGRFKLRGVPRNACHIALTLGGKDRPAPPNDYALHGDFCTRGCVNPGHLRWGSHAENMQDRRRLGRNVSCGLKGQLHGRAKLSEAQVLELRSTDKAAKDLAVLYGVSVRTIRHIRNRASWQHL